MAVDQASRVGLFGGSFDPPHEAHRALALCALEELGLDRVVWLPAGQPWQKAGRQLAPAAHRRAMVELLIEGEPRFEIDDSELRRAGASYTVDTLRERAVSHPGEQLFLIIGQDQYARLHTWRDWPEILNRATLAVAARSGDAILASPELQATAHKMLPLALPALQHSSTEVRARAARHEDLRPIVGNAVAGYIARHRLYEKSEY
ncbi:nicotinate-nucleotide adenylyltransferase [Pelomonas sp. SE-A7]|uniref:nicotinate-nucleotide adenylyltransferase n=1 Tax=Pelomonas sp. SE-A7 TaxID=3054953 RepID=UPI00259D0DAC|nr:nicotinate-nucleotide adenylyltransferase [Pelomonas sp. SE-A7]MDM4765891.1 nicotinate-nucleotide adenylyltransferase [Pelomonas sp. SE-A7]